MFAAHGAIVGIGLDPRGVPVGLARIGHGVHHKAVQVGDLQLVLCQGVTDGLFLFVEQPRGPGMGHICQKLDALISQSGNARNRLFDRKTHVGVGTVGELHGFMILSAVGRGDAAAVTNAWATRVRVGYHLILRPPALGRAPVAEGAS